MLTVAVTVGVAIILGVAGIILVDDDRPLDLLVKMSSWGVIIGFIIALSMKQEWVEKDKVVKLESLKDNSTMSGSFFLGSGYLQGRMQYTYYVKENDGFKLEQIDAASATIKYTEDEPRIVTTWFRSKNFWEWGFDLFPPSPKTRVIYVPEGSIKNVYTLDAE